MLATMLHICCCGLYKTTAFMLSCAALRSLVCFFRGGGLGGVIYNRYLLMLQCFGLSHACWSTASHSRRESFERHQWRNCDTVLCHLRALMCSFVQQRSNTRHASFVLLYIHWRFTFILNAIPFNPFDTEFFLTPAYFVHFHSNQ
jgi:hypothetical protein